MVAEFQSLDEDGDISLQRLEAVKKRLDASETAIAELQAQVETFAKELVELIVELGMHYDELVFCSSVSCQLISFALH